MLTADDITNAARVRLTALDEEAKPHEDALARINAERAKLRAQIAAGEGATFDQAFVYPTVRGPRWYVDGVPATTIKIGAFDVADATSSFVRLGLNSDGTLPGKDGAS